MESPPPGFKERFLLAAHNGEFTSVQSLAAEFENGEGPGKVLYADLKTSYGHGALHLAAAGGRKRICRFLLEKLNFNIDDMDNIGETPLFAAIEGRHQPTTFFLIKNGADVTKSRNDGITPLHLAAATGSPEVMKLLISNGSDIHATSRKGMPLHCAAMHGNLDALKFLLDLKADPNCISPIYTTPLVCAVLANSFECMELLLKAGGDPNLEFSDGQATPLCSAVVRQNKEMIRCLLDAGADPNWTDLSCKTPLEAAALGGCHELVELLFPVTSRIACYSDWSVNGVMQHIRSREAKELLNSKMKEVVLLLKSRGNEAFKRGDYLDASHWYSMAVHTQALRSGPDAKVLANRSLCWTLLNEGQPALEDAQTCVRLEPGWAKAHYREGAALKVLKRYHKAAEAFSRALALDPGNKEIENAYREVLAEGNKSSH